MKRWLGDGKAQGWRPRTIQDREETMERFCWWLEREARLPVALDPANIREFLAYAREPWPEGRFGCDRESAKREARPSTVNAYYRILRAFSNFCVAEGLSVARQCELPGLPRSSYYYTPAGESPENLELLRWLDERNRSGGCLGK